MGKTFMICRFSLQYFSMKPTNSLGGHKQAMLQCMCMWHKNTYYILVECTVCAAILLYVVVSNWGVLTLFHVAKEHNCYFQK